MRKETHKCHVTGVVQKSGCIYYFTFRWRCFKCAKKDKKKNVINTPCIHLPASLASLLLFDHNRSICLLILTIPLHGEKSREVPLASQPSSQGEGVGRMASAFLLQTMKATTPFIPQVATSCLPGSMSDSSLLPSLPGAPCYGSAQSRLCVPLHSF